jgi:hypothetical protein
MSMSTSTDRRRNASDVGEIRRLADSFEIALAARNLSPRTVKFGAGSGSEGVQTCP